MTKPGTGKDRRYSGRDVDITYRLERCIHAAYCVSRLSEVFDRQKRPWVNADGAVTERVASVIEMCPSGALHYERKDGVEEAAPAKNTVRVKHNGPLEIRGDLAVESAAVTIEHETRVTLCRCGASSNKPFCDNTHETIHFESEEPAPVNNGSGSPDGGRLTIIVEKNGPLNLRGEFEIVNEMGETLCSGNEISLCRCGGSSSKPFCDSTHQRNSFVAE